MSQHKDYPISALPVIQIGRTFTVSVMHTLADYSGSGREEDLGAFVKLEVCGAGEEGAGSISNGSMELLIGALRGAQRAADEYNDRLAKVKEKRRKKAAKAGRVF